MPVNSLRVGSNAGGKTARQPNAKPAAVKSDHITRQRIRYAQEALAHAGVLEGGKNKRVTVRLQDRLLEAARRRTGIESESALVTAGLALLAAQDNFGAWLVSQQGKLSDDFDLGL